jgi:PAS domain S-box-containing protein
MQDVLSSWLGRNGYLPHGYCFTWSASLLWSMVIADAVIVLSYYSIPLALLQFARKRRDVSFNRILFLFSAFIFACGTTHLLSIWTIWQPDYGLETLAKIATAAISLVTAVLLWPLLPKALRVPSVAQLQALVAQLEREAEQRRAAEAGRADSEESMEIALASIGAGFITTDAAGRVTRISPLAQQLTGWPRAEALGRELAEVYVRQAPAGQAPLPTAAQTLRRGSSARPAAAAQLASRAGRSAPIEESVSAIAAPGGDVRSMAVVFRDMSEVHQAQAQVRELAAIVASSNDAIIGKTLDGRITTWNEAATRLFGYSAGEAVGRRLDLQAGGDGTAQEAALIEQLRHGRKVDTLETVYVGSDGARVDVSVTLSPIPDAGGAVVGASHIVRDISERKRHEDLRRREAQLEAENRHIQESNRLKSAFLANMSHELRTPLNAIIGFAELLHMGQVPAQAPQHQEFLGHIRNSGRHLLQLINELLDLSKVESGKFEFHPEPVDLDRLTREVVVILHEAAARKQIEIRIEVAAEVRHLTLDPARLRQVLYNYLSNALKFTGSGGRVTLRAMAAGADRVRLEVQDTGDGIAPEDLGRLFTEFLQLDNSRNRMHPGTGLGLALTRRLVEAQGGSVGVRSHLKEGSVFHAILPRVTGPVVPRPAAVQPAAPEGAPRVLVIEDDRRDQEFLAQALRRAGFHAEVVATGEAAIARTREVAFSAITLDLVLPDLPGLAVLARIRADGLNRDVPVVLITMVTEEFSVAGFSVADVLVKPVAPGAVLAALSRAGLPVAGLGSRSSSLESGLPVVLVVDDDPQALQMAEAALGGCGYAVTCRQDAAQAWQQLGQIRPDAVILDLAMPGMDGLAFLDAMRRDSRWKDTPVFVWTGQDLDALAYRTLAESAQSVVHKGRQNVSELIDDMMRWFRRPVAPVESGQATLPLETR